MREIQREREREMNEEKKAMGRAGSMIEVLVSVLKPSFENGV